MKRRLTRVLVLTGLVAALLVTQGVPVVSGEEGDEPVGYTIGFEFTSGVVPDCEFYSVELESAELDQISTSPVFCADGLTFDEDGTLYAYRNLGLKGVGPAELITIDLDDGDQHVVGTLPGVIFGNGGMTFDEDGHLWLYGFAPLDPECGPASAVCLWKVDPDDGSSTFIGQAPPDRFVFGLAGDCEEVLAISVQFSRGNGDGGSLLNEVDTSDASLDDTVSLPDVHNPTGLDFDEDERLWAISGGLFTGFPNSGPFVNRIDREDGSSSERAVTLGGNDFLGTLQGLAIDGIECEEPGPPDPAPVPAPVVVEPVFTG